MTSPWSKRCRRDLLVGGLASLLTILVFVPFAWASHHQQKEQIDAARQEAQAAALRAEEKAVEADRQRALSQKALLMQGADFADFMGLVNKSGAEVMQVTTAAVTPEIPKEAWLLMDKKADSYHAGDIVVFQNDGQNYLGRVVALDEGSGRLTVARNGEANRVVAIADLLGRGVLNTR